MSDIDDRIAAAAWHGARVDWADVVGHDAAKRELRVVAEQIRRHSTAERLGLVTIKGVLLSGPPGSGKTMLAKALASAIDRPAYVFPAGEVDAKFIREVYEALGDRPCVVIWDEADVFLRGRWGRTAPEEGRTVAAFCAALDGVESRVGPVTIALTAEPEHTLDPASIRAGRLTTKVVLDLPKREDRRTLWRRSIEAVPVAGEIDVDRAAERSVGMSGADIAASVMVALGLSMIDGTDALTAELLDEVLTRRHHVVERVHPIADLRRTAIHEAGHALAATLAFGAEAVVSVAVANSVDGKGHTELGEELVDYNLLDRNGLRKMVGVRYAGMVAEELIYGVDGVGYGVMTDLTQATTLIRSLCVDLGAEPAIGPIDLDQVERGNNSDRGADELRSSLWTAIRVEAGLHLTDIRRVLGERVEGITSFAESLLAARDATLSGDELAAALRSALGGALPEPAEEPA
jgi:cell division protease FtsH